MQRLKTYLSVIDPRLLQHVGGKPGEFIRQFRAKKYLNETALIEDICQGDKDLVYYQQLKTNVLKILQSFAVVSQFRGSNPLKKKLDFCRKKFLLAQKFTSSGERMEGIRLTKQAYTLAVEYDFVHMASELASALYTEHVYYSISKRKAKYYATQVKRHTLAYLAEKEAEDLYYQYILENKSVGFLRKAAASIPLETVKCMFLKARLELAYYFKLLDYQGILKACDSGLSMLKDKKGVYSSWLSVFTSSKGIALMATGQHQQADEVFTQASKYAPARTFNDCLMTLYRTINFLHSGDYQQAYELYLENKRCRFDEIRQQFAIIEGYMGFLAHYGYVQLKKTFRIGKYLNENILTHNQKQGDNISILIAELLIYLARDRGKFIDSVEAVKNYSYRHLRDKDTLRAKRFIRILCTLPNANFHLVALRRKTQKHFTYLKKQPIFIGHNAGIIELIPFDKLLNIIVDNLKCKAVS